MLVQEARYFFGYFKLNEAFINARYGDPKIQVLEQRPNSKHGRGQKTHKKRIENNPPYPL